MPKSSAAYTIPVYRVQLVKEGEIEIVPISGPEVLPHYLNDLATSDREQMVCLFLDTKNRPIGKQTVSIGTINATLTCGRDVVKGAILASAFGIILVHNHPSGVLTPSREDDETTSRMAKVCKLIGIPLLDHVILSPSGEFYSYHNQNKRLLEGVMDS
jgi:DNA repair protein RadC